MNTICSQLLLSAHSCLCAGGFICILAATCVHSWGQRTLLEAACTQVD